MINKYTLNYSYKKTNDTLVIDFSFGLLETTRTQIKNVLVIKNNDKIIGYHVQNFSEIMKIWTKGRIFKMSKIFMEIVNNVLINAKLEPLSVQNDSGYFIAKILKKINLDGGYIYQLDLHKETRYCFSRESIDVNTCVVVVIENNIHLNNELFKAYKLNGYKISAKLCYEDELSLSNDHILITLENEDQIGEDFFKSEVK